MSRPARHPVTLAHLKTGTHIEAVSGLPARIDAVVVGGGPAGLATSRELKRRAVEHIVLERGDQPAYVWANLYDSLTLHTGRHLSGLPGRKIPRVVPLFPPREAFVRYLHDYARELSLPVCTRVDVRRAAPANGHWVISTPDQEIQARTLVMATGIVSGPSVPQVEGRSSYTGQVIHSSEYRRPSDLRGRRVLVVGVGNSGGEIGSELARAGYTVDIAVRSGANVVPRDIAGIPIQYLAFVMRKLPRGLQQRIASAVRALGELKRGPSPLPRPSVGPLDAIPLIGFHLIDEIKAGRVNVRPGLAAFTRGGARFLDNTEGAYDAVILATGFRPALSPLGDLVRRDAKGFALRTDRVASADQPRLWFVGHNYDATGGLANIARDAPLAAEAVKRSLATGAGRGA